MSVITNSALNRCDVMKFPTALVLAFALSLIGSGAVDAAGPEQPIDPFAVTPHPDGPDPFAQTESDDPASPFVEAHPSEQARYLDFYFSHYNFAGALTPSTFSGHLPPAADAEGRPLWFDTGSDLALDLLVQGLFYAQQYDDLERLFDDWSDPSQLAADGRPLLDHFQSVTAQFSRANSWDEGYRLIRLWREKRPYSRAAAIAEVLYWDRYAWTVRGDRDLSEVSPEATKLFYERIEKAEAALEESRAYASGSALWANLSVWVVASLNAPVEKTVAMVAQYGKENPGEDAIYFTLIHMMTPRMGGSWDILDAFVRDATKQTRGREGQALYARLYSFIDCRCAGFELFRDSPATWPDMKRSFEDLIARFPHSAWNINKFAAYACMAGDRETFRELRFRIGKYVIPHAWHASYSLDFCDHMFAAQPL